MRIVVEDNECRVDKYLLSKLDLSRSKLQKMILDGYVLVNNNKIKSSYVVKINDTIDIDLDYNEDIDIEAQDIDLDIIYEDDDVLVVNKPSGMVVHPANGHYNDTLVNALMFHCNNLSKVNGDIRPGIVHRIDADTSGLLLVAKNDDAHNFLAEQIAKHSVNRKYIALVHGIINEDSATIDAPIGRDKNNRKKMMVTDENSKEAITHLKVLKRYKNATLIECNLETGRTHQIRVHLSYINHPIVNDYVYGYKKVDDKDFGQMLHAKSIGFIHPKTKKYMEFSVDAPKRFYDILRNYEEN